MRVQLLQSMINKLRDRCLARKAYVSPRHSASMPLNKRDEKADSQLKADMWSHCARTTQDLLHRLRTNMKSIRLVVIDYAGFSTDFGDVQFLFNAYKQAVEIVVDIEFSFDMTSRSDILNDNGVSNKFNCRIGQRKRSRSLITN
ncbi:hypothetical protein BCV72DRAFT_204860 [Rhizopus microsporus var. microsporus]|nr:hypothetical protein BCV72DRAFT_204860 [Rhizopus microsporus var. microsporus]